jgi:hypothetical protein
VTESRFFGRVEWLECKGYITRRPDRIERNAKKLKKQFIRFARHWKRSRQVGVFTITYVFRGRYQEEYVKALEDAIAICKKRGILPASYRLPRSRIEFLGLGRL